MQISSQRPRLGGQEAVGRNRAVSSPTLAQVPDTVTLADKSRLLDAVVDSEGLSAPLKAQLYEDLSAIPSRMWRVLGQSGLRIVTIAPDRNLAATAATQNFFVQDAERNMDEARNWLRELVLTQEAAAPEEEFPRAMWEHQKGPFLADLLLKDPRQQELGFEVAVARDPVALDTLCSAEELPRFRAELKRLNGDLVRVDDNQLIAQHQVLLLPYPRVQDGPVRADHLKYMQFQSDAELKACMGTNYWQSAVVAVHQDYLPDPAPEAGHHRVVLHEVGHAIDHAVARIRDGNLGEQHRATVQRMFEQDMALEAQGVRRFSSPRARDNASEYFAEAVEAYLTRTRRDAHESKPNNHRVWLQSNNPELFAYVETVFHQQYPAHPDLAPLPKHPVYKPPAGLLVAFEKPYRELDLSAE